VTEEVWDAICVGAGITSLVFGASLAHRRPGTRILEIDKHTSPGGYATNFLRPKQGAYFDCSLHKLSGTQADGGNLWRIFSQLELGNEVELVHHDDHFDACLPHETLALGKGPAEVERALAERFPDDVAGIRQFFVEVASHGRDSYYQHQILQGTYDVDFIQLRWAHRHLKSITLAQAFAERLRDGYLREILAAPSLYVGGFAEDMSYLYFLHIVYATLYKGSAYVHGSVQRLSDALAARIEAQGGQMLLGTSVRRIVPGAPGQPHCVETSRGRYFSYDVYINASPHHALNGLIGDLPELAATREKLRDLKPSRATTTLYLTLDCDPRELGFDGVETMIFASPQEVCIERRRQVEESGYDEALCEQAFWRDSPIEVTNYHALNPEGGRVLCINALDSIRHWPIRKSKEYKAKKTRAQAVLLRRLMVARPELAGHVSFAELATPLTYQRFTNNTDGAGFGASIGTQAAAHAFAHFFPFKGIHFISAWVAGPGYEAAFGLAEKKASEWLAQA
jgi:all-trans-retinol 13,14-reductase